MVWGSWSVIDNFSPELFTFGFDPEIVSCFWGLFRSANDVEISGAPARIPIPRAPFQLIVPFQNSERTTLVSILQCAFATSGVVLVVSLSSYGMYNILQSARGKLIKRNSAVANEMKMLMMSQNLEQFDTQYNPISNPHSEPPDPSYRQLQLEPSPTNGPSQQNQPPARPTSLSVGLRNEASSLVGGLLNLRPFRLNRNNNLNHVRTNVDLDLDGIEDMQDIQGEYFGPATFDLENSLSFDESADSNSDYKTPCAVPYDL